MGETAARLATATADRDKNIVAAIDVVVRSGEVVSKFVMILASASKRGISNLSAVNELGSFDFGCSNWLPSSRPNWGQLR